MPPLLFNFKNNGEYFTLVVRKLYFLDQQLALYDLLEPLVVALQASGTPTPPRLGVGTQNSFGFLLFLELLVLAHQPPLLAHLLLPPLLEVLQHAVNYFSLLGTHQGMQKHEQELVVNQVKVPTSLGYNSDLLPYLYYTLGIVNQVHKEGKGYTVKLVESLNELGQGL